MRNVLPGAFLFVSIVGEVSPATAQADVCPQALLDRPSNAEKPNRRIGGMAGLQTDVDGVLQPYLDPIPAAPPVIGLDRTDQPAAISPMFQSAGDACAGGQRDRAKSA
ncbi:MAG TPA: hypothetical protein VFK50_06825 [Sphingomicrobium sp.]|nr:hypothetical protein [Sphingomicrobium sp.]